MKWNKFIALTIFLGSSASTYSQTILSLANAITLAQENSLQASINKNALGIVFQTFRIQRAQLFPQVGLNSNIPGYNSSITNVTQPDGTIQFKTVEQAYSNVGISLSQKIAATGGTFTASSSINRFDRLSGNRTTNYNTQPFVLGLNQPLFRFNELAYQQHSAQLNKLIGSKTFIEKQEKLALEVCNQYYAALQAQLNIAALQAVNLNTDTLLQSAKLKWALGKIEEEEYLQIQLEKLNRATQLKQETGNYELLKMKFCSLLNISKETELLIQENKPNPTQKNTVDRSNLEILYNQFKNNNPEYEKQKLMQLQNQAELERAKHSRLPGINLIAGYGSNQSAPLLNDAYQNLLTQQNATVGISMPLFTSGANNASLQIANYQNQNLQLQTQQLEQRIMNDLMKQTQVYNLSIEQINNAQFADSIAQRMYEISFNKYQAGKLTYTALLLAQNQKMQAKQSYIMALAAYWQAYYQLRVTTLYDVEKKESIYRKN